MPELTAALLPAARRWWLFVDDQPAAFAGILRRPHPKAKNIMGVSRLVTLPDWQGLGLAFVLADHLGALYRAIGERLRTYPAHPALIGGFDRSPRWALVQKPGMNNVRMGPNSTMAENWRQDARPNAVFEYRSDALDPAEARRALSYWPSERKR